MDGLGADFITAWDEFLLLKQASSFATTSSMALVVWEYFATFGQEIELVWCFPKFSQWSLLKVVYLLNRYITLFMAITHLSTTFFGAHTPTRCTLLGYLTGNTAWVEIGFVQFILQIWLYAIYDRGCHRKLLVPFSAICVTLALLVFGFSLDFGLSIRTPVHDALCVDISIPQKRRGSPWSPTSDELGSLIRDKFPGFIVGIIIAWDMMVVASLILIAIKVIITYYQRERSTGLAYILTRNVLIYCFVTALAIVSNVLLIKAFPYAMYTIGCGFAASIPNVLVNRLIFNLRAWAKCHAEHGLALDEIDQHTLGLYITQC